uniref:CBS domain-containing protein n=1 Tax=Hanusia phi TaxID=3032 RepID=A0A7S0I4S3_9CRYP|mmetsp:Transcript_9981/g.22769  ORF Transcript_9981/g.22769 Transcript_9981/m.22769 type:complete len:634 (+) Transcript_9981:73-1974(+)
MSGPLDEIGKRDSGRVEDEPGLMGKAESDEMQANIARFNGDNRNAVINVGGPSTRAVHGGERQKGGMKARATLDALATPIVQTATFTFRNTAEIVAYNEGTYESFEYGRYGNPTVRALEEKIMALENAEDALVSSSGMNAVTTMLLALVDQNGHVVSTTDCYRRTRQFVTTVLPKMGVKLTVIDPADVDELERILSTQGATLFFSEQITNPLCRVIDTERIAALCKAHNCICCIDTTFATPVNHRPIDLGSDLVLHSGTKYLAGHNDVMCGVLAGKKEYIDKVRKLHGVLGGVCDPHAAYMVLRGLKTLSLRVEQQNRTAEALARFLDAHPCVEKVHYPVLPHHRDHAIASRKSMFSKGFGGVLSFEIRGDGNPWSQDTFDATARFIDALKIPYIGPSLGGVETLVEQVRVVGYYDQPLEVRQRLSITNGLVRYACGIEDTADLIADVEQALTYVKPGSIVHHEMEPPMPKGDGEEDPHEWMRKTIMELPDLRRPITVQADTTCSVAVNVMKANGIDQLPVVQPFPGGGEGEEEVLAVLSMASLSRVMLQKPDIFDSPCFPFASTKFVVVEPTATLEEVADALNAYTDRRTGDMGCVIVAENRGGKRLLRNIVSRVDVLAFETDSLHKRHTKH